MQHPVLIFGAGPGGLLVARGLLKNKIPFRIFERDNSLNDRIQGYRVRVASEGIQAVENNLPKAQYDEFVRSTGWINPTADGSRILGLFDPYTKDVDTETTKKWLNHPTGRPYAVDRTVMREIFMQGLEPYMTWGAEYTSVEDRPDGVLVTMKDGSKIQGSLFVGADGMWSKARQHLIPDYQLLDTEARLIYGKTEMTESFLAQYSEEAVKIGGMSFINDHKKGFKLLQEPMFFERDERFVPTDYVSWGMFLPANFKADAQLHHLQPSEIKDIIRDITHDWHPSFRCLFDTDHFSLHRVLCSPRDIPYLKENSHIALIGDAIHAMSPTAAFGATSALMDADVLVRELVKARDAGEAGSSSGLAKALQAYQTEMHVYAPQALDRSLVNGKHTFGMKDFEHLPRVQMH